jgi:predicted dienelactone hydrolase
MEDSRIKAMVLAAPVGLIFEPTALQNIKLPIFLMWADEDEVLVPKFNAEALARALPRLSLQEVIHGAGHYVFMPPCSNELANIASEICVDKVGIDRVAIHARLNEAILKFFSKALQLES